MARSRNIKPGFFANDELADCLPLARLLFIGLWTIADRNGVLEYKPRKIKAQVLPYDDCKIDQLIAELIDGRFLSRFNVGEEEYLLIENFKKHQNPHKKEDSRFPEPPTCDKPDVSIGQAPDLHQTSPADSLLPHPDSLTLIPERGLPETEANSQRLSKLYSVIPESKRTAELEEAIKDWDQKRSDNHGIGLDEIMLKNQLLVHHSQTADALLSMVRAAAGGGWKNLRVLDNQTAQETQYANLDGVA